MATSHEIVDATAREGLSKFPVLPPIGGARQWVDVDQIAAAKDEIMRKLMASKTATTRLRHRRNKAQQEQRHMVLYVLLSAQLSLQSPNDYHNWWSEYLTLTWYHCKGHWVSCDLLQFADWIITGCPEQWRLTDRAKRGKQCTASRQSHSSHLLYVTYLST